MEPSLANIAIFINLMAFMCKALFSFPLSWITNYVAFVLSADRLQKFRYKIMFKPTTAWKIDLQKDVQPVFNVTI